MTLKPIGVDLDKAQSPYQPIFIDGPEIEQLKNQYRDRNQIEEGAWEAIVATAARILSKCPNPKGPNHTATGLAIGKVQSGKTLSYTALIAMAVDNSYRITVILAGTKNPLLEQTYARLVLDLNAERQSLTPFKNPTAQQDAEIIHSILHSGGNVMLVVLKHRKHIDDITELLSTPELKRFPVLVIDDEGDEASLNTQFRRNRRSPIYESILQLRRSLPLHGYIAYTATPQANLLIYGVDGLSPDFAELVEPGVGYCGGSIFFGDSSSQYLRRVGSSVQATQITDDLENAIAIFFVGGAIRWLREDDSSHSMLIHTSNLRVDHYQLKDSVQVLLSKWKDIASLPGDDPSSVVLFATMRRAYDDLCSTVSAPPSWENVRKRLSDEFWQTQSWMVNSIPGLGQDPIATPSRLKNNIFIGGNMLQRGVTLKGLAVTYITRQATGGTNADTLEQRARWFGYKSSYLDVCRIFLTERLLGRYAELLRHEDDFWEALKRNQNQGILVREWPRMFRLDMDTWELRPTRKQVADYRAFRGTGWETQSKISLDPKICRNNIHGIQRFFAKHPGVSKRFGNVEHQLVQDISPSILISELLSKLDLEGTNWDKSYIEEFLIRLQLGNALRAMDILFMSKGVFRERTVYENNRINPMSGYSFGRKPSDPNYYPGDEKIHNNRVQFQVHLIRAFKEDKSVLGETSALALYIPDDPQYDLRTVVRGNPT
jgi:hypothetical protein